MKKSTTIKCFGKCGDDWWYNTGEGRNQPITREQGMKIMVAAQEVNQPMRPHYHGIHTVFHFEPMSLCYDGEGLTDESPRTVIRYAGVVRDLPRYSTGCRDCDKMPMGRLCDKHNTDMCGRNFDVVTDFAPSPNDTEYDFLAGTGRM